MASVPVEVRVQRYAPEHAKDFAQLNLEWIESMFEVEPRDRETLEHPEEEILAPGGEIFFLFEGDDAVGTVAMRPMAGGYELEKMAVTPRAQGKGYGDRLMQEALAWARSRGGGRVILHSNTALEPAIRLYRKYGFREAATPSDADWDRCNITMEVNVEAATPRRSRGGR